jgi:hypothetical protein
MEEFKREFFKNDPVFYKLFQIIKKNHRVAKHTIKVLNQNKHIKDFCEEARHFVELPGEKPLYIHYDVASWYGPRGPLIRIESIGVYDDFIEYEIARSKIKEGPTLN